MIRSLAGVVEHAPIMEILPVVLNRYVSWSTLEERPVALGEFIAANFPEQAKVLGITSSPPEHPIPRSYELTEEELISLTISNLSEGKNDNKLTIVNQGTFSNDDLVIHVRNHTTLGKRIMGMTKQHAELLERMAAAGKLKLAPNDEASTQRPS